MKLNLGCGTDIRKDYINIDLAPLVADLPPEIFRPGNFCDLSWIVRDNEVEEILAHDCLQYIPWQVFGQVISNWCNKLQSQGRLFIRSLDIRQICATFAAGNLQLPELIARLYPPINPQLPSAALMQIDLESMSELLRANGMEIVSAGYASPYNFFVEARKA